MAAVLAVLSVCSLQAADKTPTGPDPWAGVKVTDKQLAIEVGKVQIKLDQLGMKNRVEIYRTLAKSENPRVKQLLGMLHFDNPRVRLIHGPTVPPDPCLPDPCPTTTCSICILGVCFYYECYVD